MPTILIAVAFFACAHAAQAQPTAAATANHAAALNDAISAGAIVPPGTYLPRSVVNVPGGKVLAMHPGAYLGTAPGGSYRVHPGAGAHSYTDGAQGNVWLWTRRLTGTPRIGAGALNGYSPTAFQFDVFTDDSDVGHDTSIGVRARHRFGGSSAKGARYAVYGNTELIAATHPSNANRNYVGVQGAAYATSSDGGSNTGAGAKGAIFGGGFAAYAPSAATNMFDVVGAEFNTFSHSSASTKYQRGISITGSNAMRGAVVDAAIAIGGQPKVGVYGPHVGWRHGLVFTDVHGAAPFYGGSTLIGSQFDSAQAVNRGIDLTQFVFTDYVLASQYSKLTNYSLTLGDTKGFAVVDIAGASADSSLLLRSRGAGSVYLQASDGGVMLRADRVANATNHVIVVPSNGGRPQISTNAGPLEIGASLVIQGGASPNQVRALQNTSPACSANCGGSSNVQGSDTAGIVTMGSTGTPASGWVLTFNGAWASPPACIVQAARSGMTSGKKPLVVATTTTAMTVTTDGVSPANGDKYAYHCIGGQ